MRASGTTIGLDATESLAASLPRSWELVRAIARRYVSDTRKPGGLEPSSKSWSESRQFLSVFGLALR